MQLQKQVTRKLGKKEYNTYKVVIPPKTVKELGWEKGDILKLKIKNGELVLVKTFRKGKRTLHQA